jgi:hypothetical protein
MSFLGLIVEVCWGEVDFADVVAYDILWQDLELLWRRLSFA